MNISKYEALYMCTYKPYHKNLLVNLFIRCDKWKITYIPEIVRYVHVKESMITIILFYNIYKVKMYD